MNPVYKPTYRLTQTSTGDNNVDDSFDPMVTASVLNEAITSSNNLFAQMTSALAPPPAMADSFARMINALAPPPIMEGIALAFTRMDDSTAAFAQINDSFSAMAAKAIAAFPPVENSFGAMLALVRSDDLAATLIRIDDTAAVLASTASSLAAEMLRPSADIFASSASALVAEALRQSVDLFPLMSNTLMTKPIAPYSITLKTLQSQIDADKLRRSPAEATYEALLTNMRDFEAKLDDDQEIGITLVSTGQSVTIHIGSISYTRPNVITFHGRTDDKEMRKVQLVQHTSQLNVMLIAVDKQRPKARRIGFIQDE